MTESRKPMLITDLKPEDLAIDRLGEPQIESPLSPLSAEFKHDAYQGRFLLENAGMYFEPSNVHIDETDHSYVTNLLVELAGARKKIFHDPRSTRAAIVTCGGLCPGINDVIRGLVMTLYYRYGVKNILGILYGYKGLVEENGLKVMHLTPESVSNIHHFGGTILNSSRGHQERPKMVEMLKKNRVNILFTIGGDGTQRAAYDIYEEAKEQGYPISVIGIPKTIDNDILYVDKTFGFDTAVAEAVKAVQCAHTEAHAYENGVGIVKVMGRESGFIACHTALSQNDANFVLIPEVQFTLQGKGGFLDALFKRLKNRGHAVVVVAEGAGQHLLEVDGATDASGNQRLGDIGTYLKSAINEYGKNLRMSTNVKYIDPSYIIRGVPAAPQDSLFCLVLAENAVHAAMSGRTAMVVAKRHGYYVHLPMNLISQQRKMVNPKGYLWSTVLAATGQPPSLIGR